jgi:hypothetical protein
MQISAIAGIEEGIEFIQRQKGVPVLAL